MVAAIHQAVANGNIADVKVLLNAGVDPNLRTTIQGEFTPLHIAAKLSRRAIVALLLDHGAEIDICDKRGYVFFSRFFLCF